MKVLLSVNIKKKEQKSGSESLLFCLVLPLWIWSSNFSEPVCVSESAQDCQDYWIFFFFLKRSPQCIKLTLLKYTVQWYLINSLCCTSITLYSSRTVTSTPEEAVYPLCSLSSLFPPTPCPVSVNHQSLLIYLFWIFQVKGIM